MIKNSKIDFHSVASSGPFAHGQISWDDPFKCTCNHFGFCIFVMFSTFQDEMQYIFLEKNFIFMVFWAVKVAGTDVI